MSLCKFQDKLRSIAARHNSNLERTAPGGAGGERRIRSVLRRNDQNLLLHFWQIVVLTYVPQFVDNDGLLTQKGYVLAMPDVAELREFCSAFPQLIAELSNEKRGIRPAESLIDIPVQSSLEFLRHLRSVAADKAGREQWSTSVRAIESYHMLKTGNNIKLLAFDRVCSIVPGFSTITTGSEGSSYQSQGLCTRRSKLPVRWLPWPRERSARSHPQRKCSSFPAIRRFRHSIPWSSLR